MTSVCLCPNVIALRGFHGIVIIVINNCNAYDRHAKCFLSAFFELVTQRTKRISNSNKKLYISHKHQTVIYKLVHRCTRVENSREGVPDVFDKIL
jgi:hypothetical protein